MKKLLVLTIGIFTLGQILAQDLSPDEIVTKFLDATGQEKFMKVQTVKMTAKTSQQGSMDFQISILAKQPRKMRQEIEVQGLSIVMVVDGEKGWTINPMTGSNDPQDLPQEAITELMKEGRLEPSVSWDNPLVNWKESGIKIDLVGQEDVDGASAYHLRATYEDGQVVNYFLDSSTFYILKSKSRTLVEGQEMDTEVQCTDFMGIDGIIMPKKITMLFNGQILQVMTIDTIEFNVPVDDSIFEKPVAK